MSTVSVKRIKKPSPEVVEIPHPGGQEAKLKALGGSCSDDFNTIVSCQVLNALSLDSDPEAQQRQFAAVGAALIGIKPADEIEGMLAAQMVATHNAAMPLLRRLKSAETIQQQDSAGNLATKLLRTYAMQIEALQRYRGKGQQKVTVEHVHVHSGGQAIVGAVEGGWGANEKRGSTPCSKRHHAQTRHPDAERGRGAGRCADRRRCGENAAVGYMGALRAAARRRATATRCAMVAIRQWPSPHGRRSELCCAKAAS